MYKDNIVYKQADHHRILYGDLCIGDLSVLAPFIPRSLYLYQLLIQASVISKLDYYNSLLTASRHVHLNLSK